MITTYRNKEQPNLQQVVSQRECDIVWTTSVIQPLQETYGPSQMLQIILQKSRHFVSLGQIQIQFRPIIKYSSNLGQFGSLAQKLMTNVTAVQASDFICFQSCTFQNNQILSQTNFSLTRSRNIIQNYLNQLENTRKRDKMKPEHFDAGINSSTMSSNQVGYSNISITHPFTQQAQNEATNTSLFEYDPYPRAIYERQIMYNADFRYPVQVPNPNPTNVVITQAHENFGTTLTENGDSKLNTAFTPTTGTNAGSPPFLGQSYPLIALAFTPSTAVYKEQQTRFAHFRNRWITGIITPYSLPIQSNGAPSTANQYSQINQPSTAAPTQGAITYLGQQQKVSYGQPVQGVFGGSLPIQSSAVSSVGNSTARVVGQFNGSTGLYTPPELYTNCVVHVWETAVELNPMLGGIDLVCLDSSQIVMQYNINRPESVLSAYLQDGLFMYNLGQAGPAQQTVALQQGPTQAQCSTFLNCCLLGDTSFVLTEVCCRIPYYSYPDESAYSMVRELTYRPQSYLSLRSQIDPIQGNGQMFSRLSIGGSSQVVGVFVMIVPQQANVPLTPNVSDCKLNYQGMNVPKIGDLRCVQSMDSYYVQMSDFYVQVANRRFTVNAIPISNPELSTYLTTQANLETAFGKFLNIPLNHYLTNRFCFFIPINPFGSESLVITDNQLIVAVNLDFTQRQANSKMYGESDPETINGKFSLLTYAVTQQALVDCSYVRIM